MLRRVGVDFDVVDDRTRASADVVATVVAEVEVNVAVVSVSSGDVTKSEVDERVDCARGRSKILSRRTARSLLSRSSSHHEAATTTRDRDCGAGSL